MMCASGLRTLMVILVAGSLGAFAAPAHALFGFGGKDPAKILRDVEADRAAGDLTTAIIELKDLLQEFPDHAGARRTLALSYLDVGDGAAAEQELEKLSRALGTSDAAFQIALGRAYVLQEQFRRLLLRIDADPGFAPADRALIHILRSHANTGLGDTAAARAEINEAIKLDPGNWQIKLELARISLLDGDANAAVKHVEQVGNPIAQLFPVRMIAGEAYQAAGDLDKARRAFDAVVQLAPEYQPARLRRAWVALLQRDTRTAQVDLDFLRAQNAEPILVRQYQAVAHYVDGRYAEAEQTLESLLRDKPNEAAASLLLGMTRLELRNWSGALERLEPYVRQFPDLRVARMALAEALIGGGRAADAISILEDYRKSHGDDAELAKLVSRAYVTIGRLDETLAVMRDALESHQDDPVLAAQESLARIASGEVNETIAELNARIVARPDDLPTLVALGAVRLHRKEFAQAREHLERALVQAPESPRVLLLIALSHLAESQAETAETYIDRAAGMGIDVVAPRTLLAMLYLHQEKLDAAEALIAGLIESRPGEAGLYNLHGIVLGMRQNTVGARAKFTRAIELQPALIPAYINLARLEIDAKRPDSARQHYLAALQFAPTDSQILNRLAELDALTGHPGAALDRLENIWKRDPGNREAALRYLRLLVARRDLAEAVRVGKAVADRFPDTAEVQRLLAIASLERGEVRTARAALDRLIALSADQPDGYYLKARLEIGEQHEDRARTLLSKALELDPTHVPAVEELARIEWLAGARDRALDLAVDLQRRLPERAAGFTLEAALLMQGARPLDAAARFADAMDREPTAALAVRRAGALEGGGRPDDAVAVLDDWLTREATNAHVREALALLQHRLGRNAAAIAGYERLLEDHPKHLGALNNLAWLYHAQKDPRALEFAERARVVYPEHPSVLDTLAWILFETGDKTRALALLDKAVALRPDNAVFRYHRAAALAHAGRNAEARAELERALHDERFVDDRVAAQALLRQLR
ncbi:MAG: PEP-CTERM system TPR-repeat protein PrsT [Chromatiales bacterium]|nr:PEP-CTERM system TPR-repeat protein PrsT [Chromatiales bacterium]